MAIFTAQSSRIAKSAQRLSFVAFSCFSALPALAEDVPFEYFPGRMIREETEHQHVNLHYDPSYPDLEVDAIPFEFDVMAEDEHQFADDLAGVMFDPSSDSVVYIRFDAALQKVTTGGQTQWKLEFQRDKDVTTALHVSRRGAFAYLGMLNNDIHVVDAASGHVTQTFSGVCNGGCLAIDLSPDEQVLAVGDGSGAIRLLQPSSGMVISTIHPHSAPVRSVQILQEPHGNFLLSHDWFEFLMINADDQAVLRRFSDVTFQGRRNIWIEAAGLIASNSMAVLGSGLNVKVIDVRTGDLWRSFGPTLNTSLAVQVSADETNLISFSRDHLLYRWDIDSQALLGRGYARTPLFSTFLGCSVSSDGKRFAVASVDPVISWPPKLFQRVRIYRTPGT